MYLPSLRVLKVLAFALLPAFAAFPARAQESPSPNPAVIEGPQGGSLSWYVQSPKPAQIIPDGQLFVSVSVDGPIALDESSVEVTINGIDMTSKAKIGANSVRLLVLSSMGAGRHDIHVEGVLLSGRRLPDLDWHVVVEGKDGTIPRERPPTGRRAVSFTGKTLIDTRNSDISGVRDLRQEPVRRYAVRADAEGQYGAFSFPIKLYLTTDESSITQPRNRFMLGVEGPYFAVYGGDRNPYLSPLLLNGARTRGFHGEVHYSVFHLETVFGRLRRGLEGRTLDTPPDEPIRLIPGTFERNLAAVKLGFGRPESVLFSITGLKAKDDTTSISFGGSPMENVVLGSDIAARVLGGRLRFESGAAISLTTNDISRGTATKAEIDSLFNTDLPIDPVDFDWLITLNGSTVPLRLDRLTSTAWYFNTRVALPGHTIFAEVRTVGSAFFSAANPFLQADRRTITLSDRFRFDRGRITGQVRYQNYGSLPDGGARLKLKSNLVEGRLNLTARPNLPRFTAGLRMQWRQRGEASSDLLASDLQVSTLSLGATHGFRTREFHHAFNAFYTRTARRDDINTMFDNTTHAITIGLGERFPISVFSSVQLTHLIVNYAGDLGRQRWTTLSGTVGYRFQRNLADVSLTVRNTHAGATAFSSSSDRLGFTLSSSVEIQPNMRIELQAGYDDYSEVDDPSNKYTERFVRLRHRYRF